MVPRRWMTALAALTTLMASTNDPLPDEETALRTARTAKPLVAQSALPPVALEKREEPGGKIRLPDWMTLVLVTVLTVIALALVLGVSCYTRHNSQGGGRERRLGRYERLADGGAKDGSRTLRVSPIGMASRFNRENWASISLVNLLNNYPARDVEACHYADDGGAESGTSDVP